MSVEILPPLRYIQPYLLHVENVELYVPRGYHPVDIGDIISSGEREYRVIHKLGHGGISTVWLVHSAAQSPSYFALKICCADAGNVANDEQRILEHLRAVAGSEHPNVVYLHDSFSISGPNGEHRCFLFPVLGSSLQKISAAISGTGGDEVMQQHVCLQVASAIAFLHQHGVCHGGRPRSTDTIRSKQQSCS